MKVVIDTNVLIQLLQDSNKTDLKDPATGKPVSNPGRRAQALLENIDSFRGVVIVPAPVLAEYLVKIEPDFHQRHLDILLGTQSVEIVAFDERAAIECARMVAADERKQLDEKATKAKLHVDRQIVAIAKVVGASQLWSHDKQVLKHAQKMGVEAKSLADIEPIPEQLVIGEGSAD